MQFLCICGRTKSGKGEKEAGGGGERERERLWQLAWEAKCCRAWLPKLHVRHIDVFVYVNRKCCAAGAV